MAKFTLSQRSLDRMNGVHPDLVKVVKRAIELTTIDFGVTEGLRTRERQAEMVRLKLSKTMNSRHLTGHAVDLVAYLDGRVTWESPAYALLRDAMFAAAKELNVAIVWGGDWNKNGDWKDESFFDGPHFELDKSKYPA